MRFRNIVQKELNQNLYLQRRWHWIYDRIHLQTRLGGGEKRLFHSSIVNWLLILELHRAQIGIRFFMSVFPPLLSGMLWPHWKSNALMIFVHHETLHLFWNLGPMLTSHTCSRRALGIFALEDISCSHFLSLNSLELWFILCDPSSKESLRSIPFPFAFHSVNPSIFFIFFISGKCFSMLTQFSWAIFNPSGFATGSWLYWRCGRRPARGRPRFRRCGW